MENCKPVSTPLEPGRKFQKLSPSDEPFDVQTYQHAIGCLTYVSTATRPDISAAVGVLSQYMSRPSKDHWIGVKRVLRYRKGTLKYGLKFTAHEEEPVMQIGQEMLTLEDQHQAMCFRLEVAQSAGQVGIKEQLQSPLRKLNEYVALSSATQEAIRLRHLMEDVGRQMDAPTTIYEDNQGAIDLAKNAKYHNRTKHIDICHHFVRERVVSNEMQVSYRGHDCRYHEKRTCKTFLSETAKFIRCT